MGLVEEQDTVITRPGIDPTTAVGKPPLPPLRHKTVHLGELTLEKDVPVTLRDGVRIYLDIYRPAMSSAPLPVLLAWGPYGKHNTKDHLWPPAGLEDGWISEHTGFEAPDPAYWCAHGYAVACADPRGMWNCEGEGRHNGPQEARDVYDTVEWLGEAGWSNGRVGMLGVSYLAGSQFIAAAMQPPSLKAISPWECFTDWYREFAYHGGIQETGFIPRASQNMGYSRTRTEDTQANIEARPLMSDYYRDKYPPLEEIRVPAYVVGSWSDHGLHTRGTLEAFARIASEEKWLEVHGQKKWRYFYHPESVERQRQFFDHYLLDAGPGPHDWPRVTVEVRDTGDRYTHRSDVSWPVPDSAAVRLHLDPAAGNLAEDRPAESDLWVDPTTGQLDAGYTFQTDTDVVGPMRLRLWLETDTATDADVFVAVRKFTADGEEVRFPFNALFEDGPVALGWLRASHRSLDEHASSELRPVHPHDAEEPLTPGVPVPLEIEIWPSGTRFHAGERLHLTVLGHDFVERPADLSSPVIRHTDIRNSGRWHIHSGVQHDSYLSVPMVPAARTD
ncbi:CocE/NonD family hydrolase [Georgenia halophila]|uniref:CocE/NonD family hydrolase n=1 Tax=Georgenia halophila TaxID=620889 RepID=A0ABP8LL98_9MICO